MHKIIVDMLTEGLATIDRLNGHVQEGERAALRQGWVELQRLMAWASEPGQTVAAKERALAVSNDAYASARGLETQHHAWVAEELSELGARALCLGAVLEPDRGVFYQKVCTVLHPAWDTGAAKLRRGLSTASNVALVVETGLSMLSLELDHGTITYLERPQVRQALIHLRALAVVADVADSADLTRGVDRAREQLAKSPRRHALVA